MQSPDFFWINSGGVAVWWIMGIGDVLSHVFSGGHLSVSFAGILPP